MTRSTSILSKCDSITLSWHSGAQQIWWRHPAKSSSMSPNTSMTDFSNRILLKKYTYCRTENEVSSSSSSACSSIASSESNYSQLGFKTRYNSDHMEIIHTSFTWSQCTRPTGPLWYWPTRTGSDVSLQGPVLACGCLPSTRVNMDHEIIRVPRVAVTLWIHRDGRGGAPSACSTGHHSTPPTPPKSRRGGRAGMSLKLRPKCCANSY